MRVIQDLSEALAWCEARSRAPIGDRATQEAVAEIIATVAAGDDETLRELSRRFDGVAPTSLVVPEADLEAAAAAVPADLAEGIDLALRRVEDYYRRQPTEGFRHESETAVLGQLLRPLDAVGCYVPGGASPLFSSLIMTAVPAKVAGVQRIVAATPPTPGGGIPGAIAYVAQALGIREVVALGGAHAVAALALGVGSVPRVDKVVGPGNRFVTAAKRQLFGTVGIEALAGPTETLVLADETAGVEHVVADLLAQAEHVGAQPVLVTTSRALAREVAASVEAEAQALPTAAHALESVRERMVVVLVPELESGLAVLNAYAPEHACLMVAEPWEVAAGVRNAGGLFVGAASLEALGDYVAGPSHVMPTGSTARFASFVNLRDFQKVIPFFEARPGFVEAVGPTAALLARAEGLEAHARAIESRLPK